jgi:hypothetical protein
MGTRHFIGVKQNREFKVAQYGQWDGYPTTALAKIVEFLKTDGAIEHLKRNLPKCVLTPEEKFKYPDNFEAIGKEIYNKYISLIGLKTYEEKLCNINYTKADMFKYYCATRDTGYNIPELLTTSAADEAVVIMLQKCSSCKVDWEIEAVNVIDLDEERIISHWHDYKAEWSFDNLPSEDEIHMFENGEEGE